MRIALVDPLAYTPPYDHSLASALGARGHDVVLLTGPFLTETFRSPMSTSAEEVFLPLSARLFAGSPRSRLRLPVKAVEYGPSGAASSAASRMWESPSTCNGCRARSSTCGGSSALLRNGRSS